MFKGVLIALGIIVGSFFIPIAHFVLVPASPFIGGYFGISRARPEEGSYAMKGLIFGSLLGAVMLVILVVAALAVTFLTNVAENHRLQVLMWIGVVVFTLYAGSMATLGAMYSALRARNRPAPAGAIPAQDSGE